MASTRKRQKGGAVDLESSGAPDLSSDEAKGKGGRSSRVCEILVLLVVVGLLAGVLVRENAAAHPGSGTHGGGASGKAGQDVRGSYPRSHAARRVAEELVLAYHTQSAAKSADNPARIFLYEDTHCRGGPYMELSPEEIGAGLNLCETDFQATGMEKWEGPPKKLLKVLQRGGMRVEGPIEVDLYKSCDGSGERDVLGDGALTSYHATVMPMDGCSMIWDWPRTAHLRVRAHSIEDPAYQSVPRPGEGDKKLYNVVFSAESAEYFYYQAQVNLHAFRKTGNEKNGRWTRALTCGEPDDAMDIFPTFVSKRHPYSLRYSPLNKADALLKWFASPSPPTEDVIVVIDPDNWLTRDLTPIAQEVSRGHAIANGAWYNSNRGLQQMQDLWRHLCDTPEDDAKCLGQLLVPIDLAAVPYFVHREDLAVILPRWKRLIIAIKELCEGNEPFKSKFGGLQITWGAEMLAYNFAAAEAGVSHDLRDMQVRDVDAAPKASRLEHIYMIHMGRAWLPWDYAPGAVWEHTEGRDFARHGRQVWCKCNKTASVVRPWPVPDDPRVDYASRVTLTYLHEAQEAFGDPPRSKFRKNGRPPLEIGDYHMSFP